MHPLLWVPSPETLRKPSTRLANSSPSGGHWRSGNWAKPPENEDEYQLLGASHLSGSSRINQPGFKFKKGGMYIMNHNDQYNPRNIRRKSANGQEFPNRHDASAGFENLRACRQASRKWNLLRTLHSGTAPDLVITLSPQLRNDQIDAN
jgi:hypothetical protein